MTSWPASWFEALDEELVLLAHEGPDVQRAVRRELARDPVAFAMIYMSHHLRSPADKKISFSEVHFEWCRLALGWQQPTTEPRQNRHALIAPRECGKSTWWFLVLPLWAAANGIVRFAAAFASATAQAEGHLSTFKRELETNTLLQADYPELCAPARKERGGTVADRQGMLHTAAGFVFAARGVDSEILGMKVGDARPDLLILDDIEPGEAKYSPYLAEKRLGTVLDSIFPLNIYARVVMVGTVTMPGSIMHQCVKYAQGVDEGVDEWVKDERIQPHYTPAILVNDDGTRRSVWPEKWPLPFLESIEHTRSYAKNYANDPMGRDGSYWNKDDFRYGELAGVTKVAIFVDPAVTARKTSDFTGIAVMGRTPAGRCVVLHAEGVRLTGKPLRDHLLKLTVRFPQVKRIVVEVNQGGSLWTDVLNDMPVRVELHTVSEAKEIRFAEALDFYQRGRVLHVCKIPMLEEQMVSFPRGAYDDIADAAVAGVLYFLAPDRRVVVKATSRSYI